MSNYLGDLFSECRRAEARLRDVFGTDIPEDVLISLIPKAIRIIREDDREKSQIQSPWDKDVQP